VISMPGLWRKLTLPELAEHIPSRPSSM